jgi:hypothetical protein
MYLNETQINAYERDGAIIIKGVFKDWIECLRSGFDKVLAQPSEHGRENVAQGDAGRFFEDYCNWQRIDEFKRWIMSRQGHKLPPKPPVPNRFRYSMNTFW